MSPSVWKWRVYVQLGEDRRERAFFPEDLPFSGVYVLTRMPSKSYRRRFRSGLLCSYGAFRALLTALFADSTQICSLLGRAAFYSADSAHDQTRCVPTSVSASLGVASGDGRRVTGLQLQVRVAGLCHRSVSQVYSYRSVSQVNSYRSVSQVYRYRSTLQVYIAGLYTGLFCRSVPQVCATGLLGRSVLQRVCVTGLCHRPDLCYRSVLLICVTDLCQRSVLQVYAAGLCVTDLCYRSMPQIYATGLCYRSVLLVCATGLCCRSVLQVFVTGLCHSSVLPVCATGLCYRSVLQVCVYAAGLCQLHVCATSLYYRSVLQVYAAV